MNSAQIRGKQNISAYELSLLIKNKSVVILDFRYPNEYKNYHLKNAINIAIDNLDNEILKKYVHINDTKPLKIVTYCNLGAELVAPLIS